MANVEQGKLDLDLILQEAEHNAALPSVTGSSTASAADQEEDVGVADDGVKLLRQAAAHLARSETSLALSSARQALTLLRQSELAQRQTDALLLIAHIHIHRKEPDHASRAAGDAVRQMKDEVGTCSKQAAFLTAVLAKVHLLRSEYVAAKRRAEEAEKVYAEVGERSLAANMQNVVARCHLGLGQHSAAVAAMEASLAVFTEMDDKRKQAETRELMAEVHLKRMDPDAAIKAGKDACELFHELKDRRSEAVALHGLISAQLMQKDAEAALRTAFEMVHLFDSQESGHELPQEKLNRAAALYEVADVYMFRKEPHNALNPAIRSRALYNELGDTGREVILTETLIKVHTMANQPREAIDRIYELLSIYQRAEKRPEEAATWLSLAKIHAERLMPQKASQAAEQALALFDMLEDEAGCRDSQAILGALDEVKDKLRFALMPAKEAMAYFRQTGDSSMLLQGATLAFEGRRSLAQLDAFASRLGRSGLQTS